MLYVYGYCRGDEEVGVFHDFLVDKSSMSRSAHLDDDVDENMRKTGSVEPAVGEETDCHDGPRRGLDLCYTTPEMPNVVFELTRHTSDLVNL